MAIRQWGMVWFRQSRGGSSGEFLVLYNTDVDRQGFAEFVEQSQKIALALLRNDER